MATKGFKVVLRAVDSFSKTFNSFQRQLGSLGRTALRYGAILGAAFSAGITAAVRTYGQFEMLKIRLEAVTGSAEKAGRIFEQIREYAASTPLQLNDLIDARILLEGIGVSGMEALKKVSAAAVALQKPVADVAMVIASLETEPLRRMGIDAKKTGDLFTFAFRDKMGKAIKITANGIEDGRRKILDVFGVKFGGMMEKASMSVLGLASTFRDNVKIAAAKAGESFETLTKTSLKELIAKIQDLTEGGKITSWADSVAAAMGKIKESIDPVVVGLKAVAWRVKQTKAFLGGMINAPTPEMAQSLLDINDPVEFLRKSAEMRAQIYSAGVTAMNKVQAPYEPDPSDTNRPAGKDTERYRSSHYAWRIKQRRYFNNLRAANDEIMPQAGPEFSTSGTTMMSPSDVFTWMQTGLAATTDKKLAEAEKQTEFLKQIAENTKGGLE